MEKDRQNIYLIDGNSFCYRAYYAIQELRTSAGVPTNAIYGFVNMMKKLLRTYEPEMMVIAFDLKGPTVRHKAYEDYKIHRKPMPEDLAEQMPRIKELITAYGIPIFEKKGYEADDIIATLTRIAREKGLDVTVVTSDKDALQLITEGVRVLSPSTYGDKVYDDAEVEKKYGVGPASMVDLMALMGDASDNIPGVKGIGKVTAAKLVSTYGDLEGIYDGIDGIRSEATRKKLLESRVMAELSRDLARLDTGVPVEFDREEARLGEPDRDKLAELYGEFEFTRLLKEVAPESGKETDYRVAKNAKDVDRALKSIRASGAVSVSVLRGDDGRAGGVALSWEEGKACFVPAVLFPDEGKDAPPRLKELLEDGSVKKIGHDLKEALVILSEAGMGLEGIDFDVMIADYLIDPSRGGHDLPGMSMRHLGYGLSSGGEGPMAACESSDLALRMYTPLSRTLEDEDLLSLFAEAEMPLVRVLAEMESAGVAVDSVYLERSSAAMEKKLAKATKNIHALAGEEFNINSTKQLQHVLYDKLDLPVLKRTKTGRSTDESVLRKLVGYHDLPEALLEYRELNKLKTGYYDSIQNLFDRKSSRLHARFNQTVTSTGRLSSSEPNLQNIPIKTPLGREIRKVFVSGGKDRLLLAADYSQIELRVLAHMSGDSELIEAFAKGEDVHRHTASLIFGTKPSGVTGEMRAVAKTVNFGIVYGMSPFGLAKDLGISMDEAKHFIDAYFERYRGVSAFIDRTIRSARETGFVTTLLNRRRHIPEINSDNERVRGFAERAAVNTPVQGSAADIIKLAMIGCRNEFAGGDVRMIIQVHDELVFEIPGKMLHAAAAKVRKIMEGVVDLKVPLKVDIEAGKNWLEMKELEDAG